MISCKTCFYSGGETNYDDYHCRRHAPICEIVEPSQDLRKYVPRFPIMKGSDWCGEFKEAL
jgi:hypothetical protein